MLLIPMGFTDEGLFERPWRSEAFTSGGEDIQQLNGTSSSLSPPAPIVEQRGREREREIIGGLFDSFAARWINAEAPLP